MREIVLDTETTGLTPASGDRIVEIGCIELVNHLPTGSEPFWVYINPERDMPTEAFDVHGLSEEFLADKPVFADIADAFLEFAADSPIVAHNASFDVSFLNFELKRAGRPELTNKVVDSLELARKRHPFGPNSLDALCRRYGVDSSERVKHGALLDCELLAEVYLELVGGRQPHLTLVDAGRGPDQALTREPARPRPTPLPPRLTEDEIAAHTAFIETLGADAVWHRVLRKAAPVD